MKIKLRVIASKNHQYWNLGGQQIVLGPIFLDSSYNNRLVASFSASDGHFLAKILGSIGRRPQKCPKMTQNFFFKISPKLAPNHIKISVEVRNDVFNGFRVFLGKFLLYFFGNHNEPFWAGFGRNVKNFIRP
jgi:hypothetical protein